MTAFEAAAESALGVLGVSGLCAVANRLAAGWSAASVHVEARAADAQAVKDLLAAGAELPAAEVVAYLRGLARGYARHAALSSVEPVWSGPSTHAVPVRSMAQALLDVIAAAHSELVLMTYSAKPQPEVRAALTAAAERGVSVVVVVETLAGAGSALHGLEPAAAFHKLYGVSVWHWPLAQRSEPGAKMHAKIAVADGKVLLASSANLTAAAVSKNIEAGLLVCGGEAPKRTREHIEGLKAAGLLEPLYVG